jgi:hypothetical protein
MTIHKKLIFDSLWDAIKFFKTEENIITRLPDCCKLPDLPSCFFSTADEALPLVYRKDERPISFIYLDWFLVKEKKYYAWLKI